MSESSESEHEDANEQTFGKKAPAYQGYRKENIEHNEQSPLNKGPSKIKMQYFNNNKNQINKVSEPVVPIPKVLTISDIPKELKEQIVREAIA